MKEKLYIEDIVVKEGYQRVDYPNRANIGGVGPCIGIGIYDPVKKSAYMGHFTPCAVSELEKAVNAIVKKSSSPANLKVAVVGNVAESKAVYLAHYREDKDPYDKYVSDVEQDSIRILEVFLKHGIKKSKIRNKLGDASIDGILVDTKKGTMKFEKCDPKELERIIFSRAMPQN